MTKKITLSLVLVIFIAFAFNVLAQGRELEVKYPEVQGEKPEETTAQVPEYVKYIFNFLIGISGVIALGALIYAGFQWFTSAGSPEKIQNAKDQISAALLGLLILFGSYLILTTINPDLVVFKLKRLRPIISELPAGVLVCREKIKTESGEDAILKAWDLVLEYKLLSPSEDREKEIKKDLDAILDKVALECYTISSAGDIRGDFDNKVQFIYFIPSIEIDKDGNLKSATEYGTVIYEDRGFKGISKVLASNLTDPEGSADAYVEEATPLKPSSIKPFELVYDPDENWEVILYQEYNENKGVNLEPKHCKIEPYSLVSGDHDCKMWWCIYVLPWPPKSMEIEGNLLAILCKDKIDVGHCETFFSEVENNLEEYDNIVEWVNCKDYQSDKKKQVWTGTGWGGHYEYKCAKAAATNLLIISAKPY